MERMGFHSKSMQAETFVLLLSFHKHSFSYLSASVGSPWIHNSFLKDNYFDLEPTRVRHHNYTSRKQAAVGFMGKGRSVGQCVTTVFDSQHCVRELWKGKNVCSLDGGTGSVVRWFVSVLSSPRHSDL